MEFYFIRHGQSENNRLWALTGSSQGRSHDPALTDLGWEQARRLAEFLRRPGSPLEEGRYDLQNVGGFKITHLYCSLMVRAVATGTAVSQALGLPLVAWVDAHEVGGIHQIDAESGEREGLPGPTRAYFEEHYPHLVLPDSWSGGGWWDRPFEDREQRPARARRFVAELLQRHGGSDDRVALISHGGFYNYVLGVILGLPQQEHTWFALNNVGITRIDLAEERTSLAYANRVDFLPPEMIT